MGYLEQVKAKLTLENEEERLVAVEGLIGDQQPEAVLALLLALSDPSTRVREAAVDVLGSLTSERVCSQVVPFLASEDASLRGYIIEILEQQGSVAEPHLIAATCSADDDVRKFALDILIKLAKKNGDHSPAARQAVLNCFSDPNPNVAGSAIEALGYTNNRDYLPFITKILRSSSPWMQCAAISSIVRLTGDEAAKYFATIEQSTLSEEAQAFLGALLPAEASC